MIDLERAVPDLDRPPSHPGAGGVAVADPASIPQGPGPVQQDVLCYGRRGACKQKLGIASGDYFFLHHQGRAAAMHMPAKIRCEKCGSWKTVTKDTIGANDPRLR